MSKREKRHKKGLPFGLRMVHEDRHVLVVDKPAGLLTISTNTEKSRTAYFILTDYMRKGSSRSRERVFIVHRLDRETSGLLVFAKSQQVKSFLQERWGEVEKKYFAVVHGRCEKDTDTISTFLTENSAHRVYSTSNRSKGKQSETVYTVLSRSGTYTLLELVLLTGRKHQIRVHLADIGFPVVGDRKYGRKNDNFSRLALHARSICFPHPDGDRLSFETDMPAEFSRLVREFKTDDPSRT